ncbi:hypothetical protein JZ751_023160 [Albula glossodonta]|uniref:Yippee domain-containing protein n=1 Tax=Albula glossodonta TaxID=121402 RepID=A0A8T2PI95_9TELE|nr:hypothetical protein JZ751_023160 [Albula glossodonta]
MLSGSIGWRTKLSICLEKSPFAEAAVDRHRFRTLLGSCSRLMCFSAVIEIPPAYCSRNGVLVGLQPEQLMVQNSLFDGSTGPSLALSLGSRCVPPAPQPTTALTCVLRCFPCEPSWAGSPFLHRPPTPTPAPPTSFQGSQGRAYLFNSVVNVGCGPAEERVLLTGLHAVADIYCENCKTTLGWKYEHAFESSQKYKEGKFIIELAHMIKDNGWD